MEGAERVKMSSAMTATSMLAILIKGGFVNAGESSCPSSIAIAPVVTIALSMKKDLGHYGPALSPLSYLTLVSSSSLLLIWKLCKGRVGCAGVHPCVDS